MGRRPFPHGFLVLTLALHILLGDETAPLRAEGARPITAEEVRAQLDDFQRERAAAEKAGLSTKFSPEPLVQADELAGAARRS